MISRTKGDTHLHLTKACVEHNAELRKTNAALCRGKHNATLLYHPNQDVRITVTLTLSVCWIMMDSNTRVFRSRDARNETGEHLDSKIQTWIIL